MTEDHGPGRAWSQQSYWGFGDGDVEQDHIRKLAARQRERAVCMRAEAAELRARNRLLRQTWPRGGRHVARTVGTQGRSPAGSGD